MNSDLSTGNVMGDRIKKKYRAIEALESVLGGRDIPINERTSVLKTCILLVLTYGREVRGVDSTSGVNILQTLSAPAGGAAAAPERVALAGPSAPTSTSTRWALVTL
jgi:hypothetical protein